MTIRPAYLSTLLASIGLASTTLGTARAADALPAGTLPVLKSAPPSSVSIDASQARQLTITQRSQRAIIDWNSFNIARDSGVTFLQPSSSAAVLNRIHDARPSVIQGRLNANGQVYLINRNGILFDGGSQVNVGGLVASSLEIGESLFNTNLLSQTDATREAFSFLGTAEEYSASVVEVAPGSELATSTGGRILLMAPRVVNSGSLSTPEGQTILAGGGKVYLAAPDGAPTPLRGFLVEVAPYVGSDASGAAVNLPGSVSNTVLGRILAQRGNITFAALAVNQSGRLTATTSVNLNGSIRLLARDTPRQGQDPVTSQAVFRGGRTGALTLGEGSVTEVLPDAADGKTVVDSSSFAPSTVEGVGGTIHLQRDARITATGGVVDLTALREQVFQVPGSPAVAGVRVLMDEGSLIDVSGSRDVALEAGRNVIEVELRGAELADSPLVRDSALAKQKVYVDIRKGTPLANISGQLDQIGRGILEKTAAGGSVTVRSEGDIVQRAGARIDVSGGSLAFAPGYARVTRVESDGRVFDIGDADPTLRYTGIVGTTQVYHERWRLTENFQRYASRRYMPGYVEGRPAGTVALQSHDLVLDGSIQGRVQAGEYQRLLALRPSGPRLVLGDGGQVSASGSADFKLGDIIIAGTRNTLQGPLAIDAALPDAFRGRVELSTAQLAQGGIARLEAYGNGEVRIVRGTRLELPAGGALTLMGRSLEVAGDIVIPSGTVTLATRDVLSASGVLGRADVPLTVRAGVRIDTAGRWVNDHPLAGAADLTRALAIQGGRVSLRSGGDLILEQGSLLDVSAGAWSDGAGKPTYGGAGSIVLSSGRVGLSVFDRQESRLELGAELRAFAFQGGGTLDLRASQLLLGAPAQSDAELSLASEFFTRGGFERYNLTGQDGVRVAAGADIVVTQQNRSLRDDYRRQPSGDDMDAVGALAVRPQEQRTATHLSLSAASPNFGVATLERGARLQVADGGSIVVSAGNRARIDATLRARSGSIDLALDTPVDTDRYDATQSLWLGTGALLDASAAVQVTTDALGRRQGSVRDGGKVRLVAAKGYVIAEQGSLIDVSGGSALLDLPDSQPQRGHGVRTLVTSHGGSITLAGREGVLSDGQWAAGGGGDSALGGSISVSVKTAGLDRTDGNLAAARVARLLSDGTALASGQAFGGALGDEFYGKALVRADRVQQSGADSFVLAALDRIELAGHARTGNEPAGLAPADLTPLLSLRKALILDAPLIQGSGLMALSAGYLGLGGNDPSAQVVRTPEAGDALLGLRANQMEVMGHVALSGYGAVELDSAGDLRLRGSLQRVDGDELAGSLVTTANLDLRAAQVYPSTASRFRIAAQSAEGARTIRFLPARNGREDGIALSAGGSLLVEADVIRQAGRLKAPFGRIELNGAQQVILEAGSLTSVSAIDAAGRPMIIPYGRTELTGRDYVYAYTDEVLRLVAGVPERRISLSGRELELGEGAVVDVRGGGDLRAHEFLAGPGGTRDVLATAEAAGAFAVVPDWIYDQGYAPYDHMISRNAGSWGMGENIYLSAAEGFAEGRYIILPARYALMPGAALVKPVSGQTDLLPGTTRALADGSQIVAGWREYRLLGEQAFARDSRRSAFEIRTAEVFRKQSEYRDTTIGAFFADGAVRPQDAGTLVMRADSRLALDARVLTAAAAQGRKADLDIAAPRIAVVGTRGAGAGDGVVELDVAGLLRLDAGSLLIGGTRQLDGGDIRIDTVAQSLTIDTGASVLQVPEMLLTARDELVIRSGSALLARGTGSGARRFRVQGDSALVALSADSGLRLVRSDAALQGGALSIERDAGLAAFGEVVRDGALVLEGGSVVLDATGRFDSLGEVIVADAGTLEYGTSVIRLGTVPSGQTGLNLEANPILSRLTLRSYGALEIHGDADYSGMQLGELEIQAADIAGIPANGMDARIAARRLTLANPGGVASAPAPQTGTGTLTLEADALQLGAGQVALRGYRQVLLRSAGETLLAGTGSLISTGDLSLQAAVIRARAGANYQIGAGGQLVTMAGAAIPAGATPAGLGARLLLSGRSVQHGGRIELPGGRVELRASAGNVTLGKGSLIDVASAPVAFADTRVAASAGSVYLVSAGGNVTLDEGARMDLRGLLGGDAGSLGLSAADGTVNWSGEVLATATGGDTVRQGRLDVDVGQLADFSLLNARINNAGFTGRRALRLRTGNISLAGEDPFTLRTADRVTAHEVVFSTDTGSITVAGVIDASGRRGGRIELSAGRGGVRMLSGGVLNARATDDPANVSDANGQPYGTRGRGGDVLLSAVGAAASAADFGVDLQAGSVIDVSSVGVADNGSITLRVARTGMAPGTDAGSGVQLAALAATLPSNAGGRAPRLAVEGVKVELGGTLDGARLAAIAAGNDLFVKTAAAQLAGSGFALRPGVEIRAPGDLALTEAWNLSGLRHGGEAGILTLRAGGTLQLGASLSDGFAEASGGAAPLDGPSWSYRLVGGADLSAARAMETLATPPAGGDVELVTGALVRTGTGSIDLAAARDVRLQGAGSVIYTAGAPGPVVDNFTARDSEAGFFRGGGDIRIRAGRDFAAAPGSQWITTWYHRQGRVDADRLPNHSDPGWWSRPDLFRHGIALFGGGDARVEAGRDMLNVAVYLPTNGRLPTTFGEPVDAAGLRVQGGGDLDVRAGGDIRSGSFFVDRGSGQVRAGGDLGSAYDALAGGRLQPVHGLIALGDAVLRAEAAGALTLETVFNPTLTLQGLTGTNPRISYFPTYSARSAVSLVAQGGNVRLVSDEDKLAGVFTGAGGGATPDRPRLASVLYPGTVQVASLSGDLALNWGFQMFPAARGQLDLLAQGNIALEGGRRPISMSDVDPALLPSVMRPAQNYFAFRLAVSDAAARGFAAHSAPALHAEDSQPVRVVANSGDITGPSSLESGISQFAVLPKASYFEAGRDIRNVFAFLQNNTDADVSVVRAGRDLSFALLRDSNGRQRANSGRLEIGGPGSLLVLAGRHVDLGNSDGIVTRGNFNNPQLPERGASVLVAAGATPMDTAGFTERLLTGGDPDRSMPYDNLVGAMEALAERELTLDQAIDQFLALDPVTQRRTVSLSLARYVRKSTGTATVAAGEVQLEQFFSVGTATQTETAREQNLTAFLRAREGNPELTREQALALLTALPSAAQAQLLEQNRLDYARRVLTESESALSPAQARARFGQMAQKAQIPFVHQVLYEELRLSGVEALTLEGDVETRYDRGLSAANLLYAGSRGEIATRRPGDINLFFSQIKTEQGGDIQLAAPGGLVNAGLANAGAVSKTPAQLGIVTLRGGSVQSFTRGDFLVNQSRVFTLQGGDIMLWSSFGDVDAGRGAKSARATPPPQLLIRGDQFILDTSNSVGGSGIAVLLARDGVVPGDVSLVAPRGTVNAGDAGIRSAGGFTVSAARVQGTDNIFVGGLATGVNLNQNSGISAGAASAGNVGASAARGAEDVTRGAGADAAGRTLPDEAFRPTFINVELLGFGQ